MIRGIHHTAIATRNLDRLLEFYVGLVGLQLKTDWTWHDEPQMDEIVGLDATRARVVMLNAGNMFIELFEYRAPSPGDGDSARRACDPAITHVCFDVIDVVSEYERLAKAGVLFHSPPVRMEHVHTCYSRDPDGNIVEFQELLNPKSRMQLPEFRIDRTAPAAT